MKTAALALHRPHHHGVDMFEIPLYLVGTTLMLWAALDPEGIKVFLGFCGALGVVLRAAAALLEQVNRRQELKQEEFRRARQ